MDHEWLERFHAGDPAIFRQLVEEHTSRLLGYAVQLTRNMDAARELVQDTWVHAFERRGSFRGEGSVLGWLLSICRTRFHSRYRTEARREMLIAAARAGDAHFEAADEQITPELDRAAARRRIADAIGQLPDQQRDVLVCRMLEELSTRETAERLGIAPGTVKAALHHALRNLRPLLRDLQP